MKERETDWIFDYVENVLKSPTWGAEVMSFIDEHCIVFSDEEENKLDHLKLHSEFRKIVETFLCEQLGEVGIDAEKFCEACSSNLSCRSVNASVYDQLVAMDDFVVFKSLMVQRNIELEMEVRSAFAQKESQDADTTAVQVVQAQKLYEKEHHDVTAVDGFPPEKDTATKEAAESRMHQKEETKGSYARKQQRFITGEKHKTERFERNSCKSNENVPGLDGTSSTVPSHKVSQDEKQEDITAVQRVQDAEQKSNEKEHHGVAAGSLDAFPPEIDNNQTEETAESRMDKKLETEGSRATEQPCFTKGEKTRTTNFVNHCCKSKENVPSLDGNSPSVSSQKDSSRKESQYGQHEHIKAVQSFQEAEQKSNESKHHGVDDSNQTNEAAESRTSKKKETKERRATEQQYLTNGEKNNPPTVPSLEVRIPMNYKQMMLQHEDRDVTDFREMEETQRCTNDKRKHLRSNIDDSAFRSSSFPMEMQVTPNPANWQVEEEAKAPDDNVATSEDKKRQRAEHLRKHRDLIVAKKKREREEAAKNFKRIHNRAGPHSSHSDALRKPKISDDKHRKDNVLDPRHRQMRIALAARMKRNLLMAEKEQHGRLTKPNDNLQVASLRKDCGRHQEIMPKCLVEEDEFYGQL